MFSTRSGLFAALSGFLGAIVLFTTLNDPHAKKGVEDLSTRGPIDIRMTAAGPSLSWNIQWPSPVLMDVQNTVNYQINGTDADAQWKRLVPSGGGIVHLGPDKTPFMVSTFHQLRCLDIVREAYARDAEAGKAQPTPLTRHCLNYLRQMVLCRGSAKLERITSPDALHTVEVRDPQTCRDWRTLYHQTEANQRAEL